MKLNLFTPLPPAQSDIANCVERILPALANRFDLTLWTEDRSNCALPANVKVRRYSLGKIDWRELNYADFTLYNVGNDGRFHGSIMQVAHQHPGIVVLHDLSVHELALHTLKLTSNWRDRYLAVLMQADAEKGPADGIGLLNGKLDMDTMATRYPFIEWALEGAHGVITHNGEMLTQLASTLSVPSLHTPLPYLPSKQVRPPKQRELKGKLELVVCGYLNSPNRRLTQILKTLSRLPCKEAVRLHLAGKVKDRASLNDHIKQLGLQKQVKVHGYLSEAALTELLDSVHLAINLRYPSRGEASGAQLRFWNHSLPTIVTQTAWYQRIDPSCVLFVRPDHEEADLGRWIEEAVRDYPSISKTGLNGRDLLSKRHSAEDFADALMKFLPLVSAYRRTAFTGKLAQRAAVAAAGFPEAAAHLVFPSTARKILGIAHSGVSSQSVGCHHAVARS